MCLWISVYITTYTLYKCTFNNFYYFNRSLETGSYVNHSNQNEIQGEWINRYNWDSYLNFIKMTIRSNAGIQTQNSDDLLFLFHFLAATVPWPGNHLFCLNSQVTAIHLWGIGAGTQQKLETEITADRENTEGYCLTQTCPQANWIWGVSQVRLSSTHSWHQTKLKLRKALILGYENSSDCKFW